MPDFAFYNVGCEPSKGVRRAVVFARRLLRRLLRPIFLRQEAHFEELAERLDRLERLEGLLLDGTAVARRLAAIEDHLEALLERSAPAPTQGGDPVRSPLPGRGIAA